MQLRGHIGRGFAAVGIATALTVASLLSPAHAASAALPGPTLLLPAVGSDVATNTPTLSWARLPNATKYDVWIDDNSDFTSPTKVSTTNSRYVVTAPLTNGSQFWEVRGYSGSTAGSWTTGDFFVQQLDGPSLASPADGTVLDQPAHPPVLTWSPIAGAASYSIEVASNEQFTAALKSYSTKTTSYVVPDQVPNGTYFWRVTADFTGNIATKPSTVRSYKIGPLPQVIGTSVSDADPSDTASASNNIVFDWDPVPGAAYYNVWVSSDPSFNDTQRTAVDPSTKVYGTRFSPRNNIPQAPYYWKVRAVNADGKFLEWPDVTRLGPFTHAWLDKPQTVYPADGTAIGDPLFFQWTPVPHATSYQLMVSSDPTFTDVKPDDCAIVGTTYTPGYIRPSDRCMPSEGGTYYWQVRAVDDPAGLYSQYNDLPAGSSQPHRFVYEPADSNSVHQTAPANGATVDVPVLQWDSVSNTEAYNVVVTDRTGATTKGNSIHSNRWVPNLDPAKGPFRWTVQAVDENGVKSMTPFSGPSFTLTGQFPATSGLPALTPLKGSDNHGTFAENHTARFPLLTWEPLAGSDHYKLCIGTHRTDGGTPTCDVSKDMSVNAGEFNFPAAVATGDGYFADGDYDWHAIAYDSHGMILGVGPTATFHILPLDPVSGTRLALSGTAVLQDIAEPGLGRTCRTVLDYVRGTGRCDMPETPVFAWDKVADASWYKIFVATDANLTQLVYDDGHDQTDQDRTVSTMWTPFGKNSPVALPDATASTPYFWYVLPCKSDRYCNLDPHGRTNVATNGFTKVSPAPDLLEPANNAQRTDNDPAFSWSDYLTTNQGVSWRGDHPHQAARQYRIQISADPSFPSSSTLQEEVDQTTFTPFAQLLPEGDLYWRVQAIDAAGNGLQWSATRHLKKTTPGVTNLNSPVPNAHTSGRIPFSWTPVTFAVNYRITVFQNDTSTQVWQAKTSQASYADDVPLPTSDKPYLWQVERQDASGHWSQISQLQSFFVSGDAPTQIGPAAGATVAANDLYFRWNAVDSATKYKLEYQKIGSSSTSSATVVAREYAPTGTVLAGSWQWRVTAMDAASKPMTAAPTWTPLTVTGATGSTTVTPGKDGQPGTSGDVKGSPRVASLSPKNGAKVTKKPTFRVRFSEPVKGIGASTVKLVQKGKKKGVKLRLRLSADRRTLTFKPVKNLKRKKKYTVSLTSGIKDLGGHSLTSKRWTVKVK